jgi:hypothetical protein
MIPAYAVIAFSILFALTECFSVRWTCDDAFISFRYAQNFARGQGLVFNVGERVEGYTNFLWTMAIVPTFHVHVAPEAWTQVLGAGCFAATIAILGALSLARSRQSGPAHMFLPLACVAAGAHREWAIFAVSGLETAAFALCEVAAFAVLVWPTPSSGPGVERRRALLAGLFLALGVLFRPDGLVFAGAVGAWFAVRVGVALRSNAKDDLRSIVAAGAVLATVFVVIVGAHLVFRVRYYGDWFPNTYYAKSAGVAWYGQGFRYLWLYLLRYPPLALFPFALLWLATREHAAVPEPVILASLLATAHVAWVVRVGGDFMFGRFLVPATPFVLVVLEAALPALVAGGRRRSALVLASSVLVAFVLVPSPIASGMLDSGVADEHAFYSPERVSVIDERAARVKPILEGLDARVAFYSAQARFVYRADIATAIESETGLTDAFVARQTLAVRRRVGHEKKAPPSYLIDVRHAHLAAVEHNPAFDDAIPFVPAQLNGVRMQVLHWDPGFVRTIRQRGATVADYPSLLDANAPAIGAMTRERAQLEYERARRFYFSFVSDPERERVFVERLARP